MDWEGLKLAEQMMQLMLLICAALALTIGYVFASFQMMILIYACGVVFTALIIVPNWPWFNRHPLKWLDTVEVERHPKLQFSHISGKKSSSKNK